MTKNKTNPQDLIAITIFLILVLFVWAGFTAMPTANYTRPPKLDNQATFDMRHANIENDLYFISRSHDWDSWPEKHYTPADFANGTISPPRTLTHEDYTHYQFFTHKITLLVSPGTTYGITLRSSDYAMRMFIDGAQAILIGIPGTTRAEATPRTSHATHYFTPQNETVDIIIQTSNFVHNNGGAPPILFIGSVQNIDLHRLSQLFMQLLIIGCLLTSALYHLALFIMNRKRKAELTFSICCVLLLMMTSDPVPMFFPEYNWNLMFRLEYLVFYSSFAMLGVMFAVIMPNLLHKRILQAYLSICGISILGVLLLDTITFSRLIQFFYPVGVSMILYGLVRMGMEARKGRVQDILGFVGLFVITLFTINDVTDHIRILGLADVGGFIGSLGVQFTAPVGMVFFVFCYALLLALRYADTEKQALEASIREKALAAENATLDNLSRMKSEYMSNLTHETKTPLTVISTHVQQAREIFAEMQDENNALIIHNQHFNAESQAIIESLDIVQEEIMRLSRFAGNALWLAATQENSEQLKLDMSLFLMKGTEAYRSVIEKQGNTLNTNIPANLPFVFGEADQLVHVMVNLLTNANTHTKNGVITVAATAENEFVKVTITDNGIGIAPDLLPHVFLRGVTDSKEAGTGMGLPISKNIIESHGGKIAITSEYGNGTTVTFTIPFYKNNEDKAVDNHA